MAKSKASKSKLTRLLISLLLILVLVVIIDIGMSDPLGLLGPQPVLSGGAETPSPSSAHSPTPAATSAPLVHGDTLDVYILDVGQGDSIFIKGPSDKTMLIDASTSGMFKRIDQFLKEQKINKLDVVIGTHPHADHIGGMQKIIENYEVGAYFMPDAVSTSQTFEGLLDALRIKKVPVKKAQADMFISWDEAVEVHILSPFKGEEAGSLNNYSIVCRMRFGEMAILLTGDAEEEAENRIMLEFPESNLSAQILKLGHHGSSTSSSLEFLKAVNPEAAISSVGEGNTYGHPHTETIEKLKRLNIKFYRTDLSGAIVVRMSKNAYVIETQK